MKAKVMAIEERRPKPLDIYVGKTLKYGRVIWDFRPITVDDLVSYDVSRSDIDAIEFQVRVVQGELLTGQRVEIKMGKAYEPKKLYRLLEPGTDGSWKSSDMGGPPDPPLPPPGRKHG